MADISKITLPSGTTYDIKDAAAREAISGITGAMHFIGVTTTAITNGASTNPISIGGSNVTAKSGDVAIYGSLEFVFSGSDSKWHEFGSTGSLKSLAFKDSASGNYTPSGSVSKPTFTGTQATIKSSFTPAGSVTIGTGTGTTNYTPSGSVAVTLNTASKYVASSASGGGSVTAGSAAACTLPSLSTSVSNETLTIGWSAGSFTANKPTAVTLPTFASQTIATGVKSQSFTGAGAELTATFSGTAVEASAIYTPAGSVSQPSFTGTQGSVSVS